MSAELERTSCCVVGGGPADAALNPGYIKGYVPAGRENDDQYTHAAVWAAMAFAALGDSRRAWDLPSLQRRAGDDREGDCRKGESR